MLTGLPLAAVPVLASTSAWPLVLGFWIALFASTGIEAFILHRARPELSAEVPSAVGVGDCLDLPISLTVRGSWSLKVRLRPETLEPLTARRDLEAWFNPGRTETSLSAEALKRGVGGVPAIWLRATSPFGLLSRVDRMALENSPVRVIPSASRVRNLVVEFFGSRQAGSLRLKRLGDGTELDSLETYEPGMDLRQVDWKSSARHQALRVRRFRLERNQRITVCLDTGRLAGDRIEGLERLDHEVHAALALSWIALRSGDHVGLHAYAAEPVFWLPPRAGIQQMRAMQEACSRLHTQDEETNHVLGIEQLLTRLRRRNLVVVFTELGDPTSSELMVRHVRNLIKRHLVILVALDDPLVTRLASEAPNDVEHLGSSLVAGSLVRDRERVIGRLRRVGVDVVHGPPGRAALDLLARYIRLKRRRLLG